MGGFQRDKERAEKVGKGKAKSRPGIMARGLGLKERVGQCWLAADPSGHIGGDNHGAEGHVRVRRTVSNLRRRVRHAELSPIHVTLAFALSLYFL